jgi:8-oxo-dGTP diphosphatase
MAIQYAHCSYCGTLYPLVDAPWPRVCAGCGETTWRNPLPVAIVLLPVDLPDGRRGVVVVRRAIEPCLGELCLPGGFMELGETWREAAVRELREETGLLADAAEVRLFDVYDVAAGMILVCGLLPPRQAGDLPPSAPTEEATEWLVLTEPVRLAFPTHTGAVAAYFTGTA